MTDAKNLSIFIANRAMINVMIVKEIRNHVTENLLENLKN